MTKKNRMINCYFRSRAKSKPNLCYIERIKVEVVLNRSRSRAKLKPNILALYRTTSNDKHTNSNKHIYFFVEK